MYLILGDYNLSNHFFKHVIYQKESFTKEEVLNLVKKEYPQYTLGNKGVKNTFSIKGECFLSHFILAKVCDKPSYSKFLQEEKWWHKKNKLKTEITTREDGCIIIKAV